MKENMKKKWVKMEKSTHNPKVIWFHNFLNKSALNEIELNADKR